MVHAAEHGHLAAVSFILQCDWSIYETSKLNRKMASQQALIAAAANGHKEVRPWKPCLVLYMWVGLPSRHS